MTNSDDKDDQWEFNYLKKAYRGSIVLVKRYNQLTL